MTPYFSDEWLTVYGGDARTVLAEMPAESVHCVVTSPPYWGLRDYGTATWTGGDPACDHTMPVSFKSSTLGASTGGRSVETHQRSIEAQATPYRSFCGRCGATRVDAQLGLERTPEEYVAALVGVFREVRRVLRDDGTVWCNLGDSYRSTSGHNYPQTETFAHGHDRYKEWETTPDFGRVKPKDLVGIPWRVAFALQADGWYLRSEVIWAKPNPMPESVTDRPTKSHEQVFLLSKSPRYFFDSDAVREADAGMASGNGFAGRQGRTRQTAKYGGVGSAETFVPGAGRNIRSVWTVATAPYPGAHFATFPPKLVEPMILAGCPDRACAECGAPWERESVREIATDERGRPLSGRRNTREPNVTKAGQGTNGRGSKMWGEHLTTTTLGFRPTCAHDAPSVPGTVLDPFAGTGTVGMVAAKHSRRAVLVDLNPDYLAQCLRRNAQTPLGLPA